MRIFKLKGDRGKEKINSAKKVTQDFCSYMCLGFMIWLAVIYR